jgi:hypothetical protein
MLLLPLPPPLLLLLPPLLLLLELLLAGCCHSQAAAAAGYWLLAAAAAARARCCAMCAALLPDVAQTAAHAVGVDGTEGEVLSGSAELGQKVEQGALAHIWQAHNAHLQKQGSSIVHASIECQ